MAKPPEEGSPKDPGSSSAGPRVPPPPTLSFMGEKPKASKGPEADNEDARTIARPGSSDPSANAPAPEPGEDDEDDSPTLAVDSEGAVLAVKELKHNPPPPPPPRRGVLPPPASDGKRVQPVAASRRARVSSDDRRTGASGLPAGLRPPGAPEHAKAEDTDLLIASAVAALTEDDEKNELGAEASVASFPLPMPAEVEVAAAPVPVPPPSEAPGRRGPWLPWLGAAALVGAVGLAVLLWPQDDAEQPTVSAQVHPGDAQPSAPAQPEADPEPSPAPAPPQPEVEPVPAAEALDVGAFPETELDVGAEVLDVEDKLDVGSADPESVAQAEESPVAVATSSRTKKKRQRNRDKAKSDTPTPKASSDAAQPEPDAAALLAEARKALSSGNPRRAYTLAAKSRRAKKSSQALVIMARAACRFGGESQAKSAFGQLSVSDRRGIRSECRTKGIRLGL